MHLIRMKIINIIHNTYKSYNQDIILRKNCDIVIHISLLFFLLLIIIKYIHACLKKVFLPNTAAAAATTGLLRAKSNGSCTIHTVLWKSAIKKVTDYEYPNLLCLKKSIHTYYFIFRSFPLNLGS